LELSGILKNDTILSMVVCNERRRTNYENGISAGLDVEFGERGGERFPIKKNANHTI